MKWYTRPVDQGQMVEVSYAYDFDGGAYRRRHDRSDGSTTYEYGAIDWDNEPECIDSNRAPCVESWEPCAEPQEGE